MYVNRHAREQCLDLAAYTLSLQTVVACVATSKHLYAVACHLDALHNLLLNLFRGIDGGAIVMFYYNGLRLLFLVFFLICSSIVFFLFLLSWFGLSGGCIGLGTCWHYGWSVHQFVDGLVLCYGDLALTVLALLESLGKRRLSIGRNDAADAERHYDNKLFHFITSSKRR